MSLQTLAASVSNYIFLAMVAGIPAYAALKKVKVYESFITGAKGGIEITVRIVPYLVAMLVAIGMFRASGGLDVIAGWLSPALALIGMPAEVLPLALIRPFSGTASTGVMAELISTHGGDAYISQVAATMMGSTETTFYVIAIYFGAANIRRTRHAIPAGLLADLTGILAAVLVVRFLLT